MPRFLSAEWLAALDAGVRSAPDLAVDEPVVVQHEVRMPDGTTVRYRVRFGPDGASFAPSGAGDDAADVTLRTDRATAWALHQGELRAQDAFARGDLKVRGRPEVLAGRADLLTALARAVAAVRSGTDLADDR
jgi:hypothetical protein